MRVHSFGSCVVVCRVRDEQHSTGMNSLSQWYSRWVSLLLSLCPLFRHADRRVYLTIHVDDLLAIGSDFDCQWFLSELSLHFNLKSNGPFSSAEPAEVQYLKKNIIVTPDGCRGTLQAVYS